MSEASETLHERLERLERERLEAHARYNEALSALDRSIGLSTALPQPPPAIDPTGLDVLNRTWDLLPSGSPVSDRSLKGRLRGFIWRVVGPAFDSQRQFNATLVDHLNRNMAVHAERQQTAASTLSFLGEQFATLARFQSHLIHYLQTITALVDTAARSAAGRADVVNAAVSGVSDDMQKRWESLAVRDARLQEAYAAASRDVKTAATGVALAQQTALSLKREMERWLASGSAPPSAPRPTGDVAGGGPTPEAVSTSLDSFKYLGFENEFRGPVDEIRRRLEAYLPLFAGQGPVLDIGCGRGEFLDLLRGQGISARGIDINESMVEETRARGLDAEKADALAFLSSLPDGSLGGIFAAQVIEHLPADYLTRLVEVAAVKLRPGGIIVLETINPTCWVAFFESYIRDLTHVRPLHPETMQYLLRVSGFQSVRVQYSAPVAPEASLLAVSVDPAKVPDPLLRELVDTANQNAALLNGRLFGFQDYAVIGSK